MCLAFVIAQSQICKAAQVEEHLFYNKGRHGIVYGDPKFNVCETLNGGTGNTSQRGAVLDKEPMKKAAADTQIMFLLGGAGAGKSTVGRSIAKDTGFGFLSLGDLIRAEKNKQTSLGKLFEANTKAKKLQPTDLILKMVFNHIQLDGDHPPVYVIDGFPRQDEDVELWKQMAPSTLKARLAIHMKAPFETRLARLAARGRSAYDIDRHHQEHREKQYLEESNVVEIALRDLMGIETFDVNAEGDTQSSVMLIKQTLVALDSL
jgi:adenylate kinase